jgi:RNA polymerase sigma-70 factor, ECF subfamily
MTQAPALAEAFQSVAERRTGRFGRGIGRPDDGDHLLTRAIDQAKSGDVSALHFLYVRFADDVYAYVRSILHHAEDAEDITQNVFAKLMTAIGKYERQQVPFRAWILRVARNAALDHARARRFVPCEEIAAADNGDGANGVDRGLALKEALDSLPEEQREVLVLRHIGGLTPAQIAELLEKSEGSIHGLHHRGRRRLQALLRESDAVPVVALRFSPRPLPAPEA